MYQIFVVEDELLIRQNIRSVIEQMSGPFSFCGEASDGEMALSMMQELMPDIVITDIRMPFLDGFELIRHAKAMMPWLKVIILSGYGDFESAQKAIALGVDQYLLKPVRQADLTRVVEEVARQMDAARRQDHLPRGFEADDIQRALRGQFMQQLLYGGLHTSRLLEKAQALKLDILRPQHQLVLFSFGAQDGQFPHLHAAARAVLEQQGLPLFAFNAADQLTVLFGGQASELTEQVYRFISILRHELRDLCPVITAVVSSVVTRLSMVGEAYRAASDLMRRVCGAAVGQVIDVNDSAQMAADLIEMDNPFGEAFQQKLQYATEENVASLVDEVLSSPQGSQFNSMLMRYNALVNLLKMTVQQISRARPNENARDIATKLSSQYNIFETSRTLDGFRQTAVELLSQAVRLKQSGAGSVKNCYVISAAEKYLVENFCDPNISLMSVARHIGLSPAHFSTVFSQTTGRSFINYLTMLRMERAKELLTSTSMKLAAIATDVGYNEPNYFSHVFRKQTGMTPKEYRSVNTPGSPAMPE